MADRLIHYAPEPLLIVRSVQQAREPSAKPIGLWFSVEGEYDWRSWCEAESFCLPSLVCETEITFAGDARILRLSGARAIDAFTAEYASLPDYAKNSPYCRSGYYIDWRRVAERHDAIVIAPYCWDRRLHQGANWYYGWDCASGCVWNAEAVADLRPIIREIEAA